MKYQIITPDGMDEIEHDGTLEEAIEIILARYRDEHPDVHVAHIDETDDDE